MASKRDRNSLIECIHLLYPNRTAESAFRQIEQVLIMSQDEGRRQCPGLRRFIAPTLRFSSVPS